MTTLIAMHSHAQTILRLYIQLQSAGYSKSEMELIRKTYEHAMSLFSGRFQPSGKTFIAHVVGTASILASHTRNAAVVAAGLLHNVYEHGDFADDRRAISESRRRKLRNVLGTEVEDYLARFAKLRWTPRSISVHCAEAERLSALDRDVVLIRLADHLEHLLDLDVLYYGHSGRRIYVDNGPAAIALAAKLGFSKLAAEIEQALNEIATSPVTVGSRHLKNRHESFVLSPASCLRRLSFGAAINRLGGLSFTTIGRVKPLYSKSRLIVKHSWSVLKEKTRRARLDAKTPGFRALFPRGVLVERVATGFEFTEGPVWVAEKRSLLFSDIPADRILQVTATNQVAIFRHPSGNSNGLTRDREGRLIACEHGNRRVTRTEKDGRMILLADHFQGKKLNSPNDVVVKSDGAIYFTDPPYGIKRNQQEQPFQAVYRLSPDGKELSVVASDFAGPNGLTFSPDEKRLYIADSQRRHIRVFDVKSDSTLSNGRIFYDMDCNIDGSPDGMKVDADGNIYCAGPGGVWVFNHNGDHMGTIVTPEKPSNCAWGGEDWRSLYITAQRSIYKVRATVPGANPPGNFLGGAETIGASTNSYF